MADRLASIPAMHDVSPNFAITHADASREDEGISLASIHQQLSKLTASNDVISAEVAELKRSTSYIGNHRSRGVSRADTIIIIIFNSYPKYNRTFQIQQCNIIEHNIKGKNRIQVNTNESK